MPLYTPPVADQMFTLAYLAGYGDSPAATALDLPTAEAVLAEAGKLAAEVLAPLNAVGDVIGASCENGVIVTARGWKDAYGAYRAGGWNAVPFPADYGGQGLPWAVAFPVQEMWQGANLSFGLCPLLNQGAVEAILAHGSDAQKKQYLPKMVSGEWTGTMNLTEPQAGSDLGAIRTKAEKQTDGTYKISGQKIFITYGEHDLTDNIIHLVLARVAGAPDGAKGISLFIVPKFLADGSRNDVVCASVEHKLGIHASPTCTMMFGEKGGATGYLVGGENEGLKYMFTMMNNARLSVGLQGVAVAERATQAAMMYAKDRVQGKGLKGGGAVTIDNHADVKRMILTMQALTFAARALTFAAAVDLDRAHVGNVVAQDRVELFTPIVKAWGTDIAQNVTSLAVQVHGGMGFVEETGVAQYVRDARILPIYEGTNGIQAMDLVFRKIAKTDGKAATEWLNAARVETGDLLKDEIAGLIESTQAIIDHAKTDADTAAALATPYLNQFGVVAGGVMMARTLKAIDDGAEITPEQKVRYGPIARFYLAQILPMAEAYRRQVAAGGF